jgi:adenylate kinase
MDKTHILLCEDITMKIAITGTPGVGKTIVAQQLSEIVQMSHIDITKAAIEMNAVSGKNDDTIIVDLDILKEKLGKMDDIIIDSHFAEVFDVDLVFVLRCEPKILYERLTERGYSERKVKENVLAEILDYCLISALEHHDAETVFEITENAVEEITEIVHNPKKERSLAFGTKTQFLSEENLELVE